MTILYNVFRNVYRSTKRRPVAVGSVDLLADRAELTAPDNDPADIVTSYSLDQQIHAALESLPDAFREVVVLVDLQELTYEEAAQAIGCPIGTVRSRLSRGRQMLHTALQPHARREGFVRSK